MDKQKWTQRFQKIRGKLSFLSLSDNDDLDEMFETERNSLQNGIQPEIVRTGEEHPDGGQSKEEQQETNQEKEDQQSSSQSKEGQQEINQEKEDQQSSSQPKEGQQEINQEKEDQQSSSQPKAERQETNQEKEDQQNSSQPKEERQGENPQEISQPNDGHQGSSQTEEDQQAISGPGDNQREISQKNANRQNREVQTHREPRKLSAEEVIRRTRINQMTLGLVVIIVIACAVWAFYHYNQNHTFDDYVISKSVDNTASLGTQFVSAGKYLYRYNSDGVTCVTRNNEVKWSITYSMQAPITDVCGTTMVIAEQQGTQVYVINEDGLLGSFTCLLPILKVRVSEQGVVAVVLKDDDVTWVRLYDSNGENIANDKTTISDSGYPLDIDLSPNGEKMVVSYLGIEEGVMTSNIVFYDFGPGTDNSQDHVISSESFPGSAVPEVYFKDNSTVAAVADDGFVIFTGTSFKKSAECWFEDEIVSCFHDDSIIGFLFADTTGENSYRMDLYNYHGKLKASAGADTNFDSIKVQNGRIIMYTSSACSVYTMKGKLQYSSAYEKEIVDMFYFSEYRRYLVITKESFDRIRIC